MKKIKIHNFFMWAAYPSANSMVKGYAKRIRKISLYFLCGTGQFNMLFVDKCRTDQKGVDRPTSSSLVN